VVSSDMRPGGLGERVLRGLEVALVRVYGLYEERRIDRTNDHLNEVGMKQVPECIGRYRHAPIDANLIRVLLSWFARKGGRIVTNS
jgi:hypothetical protein